MKKDAFAADSENSRPTLRQEYFLERDQIIHEFGDLEQMRQTLALSQRRLCRLLLVDPSAWTRWCRFGAPPHIYQALKWLVQLRKINPEAVAPSDLNARVDFIHSNTKLMIEELEQKIRSIENQALQNETSSARAVPILPENISELKTLEARLQGQIANLQDELRSLLERSRGKSGISSQKKTRRIKTRAKRSRPKAKARKKTASSTRKRFRKKLPRLKQRAKRRSQQRSKRR